MRKQNRNNRICTNEESGKTDFIIDPLLPIGKENAITTQELMRISGCGSSRELRQRIALERERGAIICSGSGRGYWKPKNRQEIQEFIKTMDARAWNTLKAAKGAKKALRTPEGQEEYEKLPADMQQMIDQTNRNSYSAQIREKNRDAIQIMTTTENAEIEAKDEPTGISQQSDERLKKLIEDFRQI